MKVETCMWCGRGLPPEHYGSARALIEDLVDMVSLSDFPIDRGVESVVRDMRAWLARQPPRPHIIG